MNSEEKKSLMAEIKASGISGSWSASAGFEKSLRRVEKFSTINSSVFFEGNRPGSITEIPKDATNLLALASKFHTFVDDNDTATNYGVDYIDYLTLPDVPARNPIKRNHRRRVLNSLAEADQIARTILSNTRYIAGHHLEFDPIDYDQIEAWEKKVIGIIKSIATYASSCFDAFSLCKDRHRTDLLLIAQSLPKQKQDPVSRVGCNLENQRFISERGGCHDTDLNNIWSKAARINFSFQGAQSYCAKLRQNGQFGWVLPTVIELKTISGIDIYENVSKSDGINWYWGLGAKRVNLSTGIDSHMDENFTLKVLCKKAYSIRVNPLKTNLNSIDVLLSR